MLLDCLILVELHKRRSYFLSVKANLVQIFFLWVVWIPRHERSVLAFFHMILQCAFICCATCTIMLLDFSELHKWRQDFQSICAPQYPIEVRYGYFTTVGLYFATFIRKLSLVLYLCSLIDMPNLTLKAKLVCYWTKWWRGRTSGRKTKINSWCCNEALELWWHK